VIRLRRVWRDTFFGASNNRLAIKFMVDSKHLGGLFYAKAEFVYQFGRYHAGGVSGDCTTYQCEVRWRKESV
jgi:hypothetical protein